MAFLNELFPGQALPAIEIKNVSIDSRQIGNDTLFVACKGEHVDGHQYLAKAQAAGAVAAVVKKRQPQVSFIQIEVDEPKEYLGELCAKVYGTKEKEQTCLAFTGTDGKTTMASLAEHILLETGRMTGFIGTTGVRWPSYHSGHSSFTTPFPPQLHRNLQEMRENEVSHVCMEISSHALAQNRVAGLRFKTACFSHLAVDHLDFHQTIEAYALAKAKLFEDLDAKASVAILNADDLTSYLYFTKTKSPCIFYSLASDDDRDLAEEGLNKTYLGEEWLAWQRRLLGQFPASKRQEIRASTRVQTWRAKKIQPQVHGYSFELVRTSTRPSPSTSPSTSSNTSTGVDQENAGFIQPVMVHLPLYGEYNIANALASLASVHAATNLPLEVLSETLQHFHGIVGRMENIASDLTNRWQIIVDFAHTPGALAALLQELKTHLPIGAKLWTLCNSCGDRDRGKRPLIGRICQKYADEVILTLEEVGHEDPAIILSEIETGLCQHSLEKDGTFKPYFKIPLRQEAIRFAIHQLKDGDILLLPSLGDEETYTVGKRKLPYSDKAFARQVIEERLMVEALSEQSVWKRENFYQVVRKNER